MRPIEDAVPPSLPAVSPEGHTYQPREEFLHVATHGLGVVLSLAGLALLLRAAVGSGDPWRVTSAAVYGGSLVLLYLGSTLYHSARSPAWRRVARVVDHSSIYLLIAGTYTPFTLVTLRGAWGWTIFTVVWGLAVLGIAREALWARRRRWVSVVLYLVMGWLIVVAIGPLVERLPAGGLRLLVLGGLAYT
ncbi:MAG: hemolysin III family protein, partial [Proteobacteria bacterium]|nr:hemolysin III family protein [Pseudomonadota bacterium]